MLKHSSNRKQDSNPIFSASRKCVNPLSCMLLKRPISPLRWRRSPHSSRSLSKENRLLLFKQTWGQDTVETEQTWGLAQRLTHSGHAANPPEGKKAAFLLDSGISQDTSHLLKLSRPCGVWACKRRRAVLFLSLAHREPLATREISSTELLGGKMLPEEMRSSQWTALSTTTALGDPTSASETHTETGPWGQLCDLTKLTVVSAKVVSPYSRGFHFRLGFLLQGTSELLGNVFKIHFRSLGERL